MSRHMCDSGIGRVTSEIDDAIYEALAEVLGTDSGRRKKLFPKILTAIQNKVALAYDHAIEEVDEFIDEVKESTNEDSYERGREEGYDQGWEEAEMEKSGEGLTVPCPLCSSESEYNTVHKAFTCKKCRREYVLSEAFIFNSPK